MTPWDVEVVFDEGAHLPEDAAAAVVDNLSLIVGQAHCQREFAADAGTPFSVTVTALDENGNVVLDNFDTVNLAITGQTGSLGTVTLSYGTGTADVTIPAAGTFTLTGTDMTEPVVTGQSNSIVVNPAHFYIVTNTNDSGAGSLRQALLDAATAGDGTITFSPADFSTPQTIGIQNTLTVPANTTIQGPTSGSGANLANLVTIDGAAAGEIMSVSSSVTYASVSNLIFTNARFAGAGAIGNAGTFTVSGSTFSNNLS